jgi:hypothetical protein
MRIVVVDLGHDANVEPSRTDGLLARRGVECVCDTA